MRWLWDVQNLRHCKLNGFSLAIIINYFNLVTDVIILLLPAAVVARLQMDIKRRCTSSPISPLPPCISCHILGFYFIHPSTIPPFFPPPPLPYKGRSN
jgi:hypothetical protein